jgi:three-Cys-motif partner protein
MDTSFFDESLVQSQIKAAIVSKYFWAWTKVIIPRAKQRANRVAYIDLFAGPGRYKDGTKSTPLLVLEKAIQDTSLREMLVTIFNDKNSDHSHSLEQEIRQLPGIEYLRHPPKVFNHEVGTEIVKAFEEMSLIPTFFFVDPWGYKGLSLRLVNAVLKDWGCDGVFFFNYNRINMGLGNTFVQDHIDALFGIERGAHLRQRLISLNPQQRELQILEEIIEALRDLGGKYVLPFCFRNASGNRTSHHLIFVSKNVLGYKIMKDIMAQESSSREQGVPTFEYNPASVDYPLLFELARPLDSLEGLLIQDFAGQTLTMGEVYERHHIGRRYIEANYKEALTKLESKGVIRVNPPAAQRRKHKGATTFPKHVQVTFPKMR